uniref:Uncharacterized protein n=1 Tax=Picea glauca TaxID=3330 RepID=A0A101LUQ0_PICGL|nr:hypothetical protein ABT39_MTgene2482 [Picea glauca]QHR88561.1 hypothetical protein Q903MT_gene2575 [Picea sitchensis]
MCLLLINALAFWYLLRILMETCGSLDWPPVMNEFSDCVANSELVDLGCRFTWTNGQEGGASLFRKLDRALVKSMTLSS